MNRSRLLVYAGVLVLLAWLLSSLARTRSYAGILTGSYWLSYAAYLLLAIPVGIGVVMVLFVVSGLRGLSFRLRPRTKSKTRPGRPLGEASDVKERGEGGKEAFSKGVRMAVLLAGWTFVSIWLLTRCFVGGAGQIVSLCPPPSFNPIGGLLARTGEGIFVSGGPNAPTGPLEGLAFLVREVVESELFVISFGAMLVVSTIVTARSFGILTQTKQDRRTRQMIVQRAGLAAVEDAISIVRDQKSASPRTRIMDCYNHMIKATSELGAPITPDQTAKELETGLRKRFNLKGPAIKELTNLFEEARYSLHPITEEESHRAQDCLASIQQELTQALLQD